MKNLTLVKDNHPGHPDSSIRSHLLGPESSSSKAFLPQLACAVSWRVVTCDESYWSNLKHKGFEIGF